MRNENGQFIGFYSPKYTQVPDDLFDELMPELTGAELKVLMYVIRRTFGFKKDSDHISLSQMVNGITKRDGTAQDKGTGLSKEGVSKALKSLVSRGILLKNRKQSETGGFAASEYSLNLMDSPLSNHLTSHPGQKSGQPQVQKSDIQDTLKQDTYTTLGNAVNRSVKSPAVDKLTSEKREYLARRILETCRDNQSLAFYRKVVRLLPERAVHEALSQVKEAEQLGRIRERPGAMFTDLIKRKAKELGIDFRIERQESEPSPEPTRDSSESRAPAEIMMAGRVSRR